MSDRRTIVRITLASWLVYLAFLAPSLATMDGGGMLSVAISIVEKHDITVDPSVGVPGRGGKYYSMWYPLLSIIAVPFAAAGHVLSRYIHLPENYLIAVAAIVLSTMIAAANVGATYWLARILGVEKRYAVSAGMVFGFCTLALEYSRSFYADPLLTLFVTLGIGFALETGREYAIAACSMLAILSKPPGVLLGVVFFAYAALRKDWRKALAAAAGTAIGSLLYLGWNFARFGDIARSGQPDFWQPSAAPLAFAGLLFSPSVGLFICCPIVVLSLLVWRKGVLIWVLTLCLVIFYSFWARWYASDWGPRFLMPVIPALVALSALTRHRKIWIALAALGLLMQIPTLTGYPERYQQQLRDDGLPENAGVWNPALSPIVQMWPTAVQQIRDAQHEDVNSFKVYRPHATNFADARNFRIVPLWWWMLPLLHIPRLVGQLVSLLLVILGAAMVLREASSPEPGLVHAGSA